MVLSLPAPAQLSPSLRVCFRHPAQPDPQQPILPLTQPCPTLDSSRLPPAGLRRSLALCRVRQFSRETCRVLRCAPASSAPLQGTPLPGLDLCLFPARVQNRASLAPSRHGVTCPLTWVSCVLPWSPRRPWASAPSSGTFSRVIQWLKLAVGRDRQVQQECRVQGERDPP